MNAVLDADLRLGERTCLTFREIGGGGDLSERDVKLSCAKLAVSSFGVRTTESIRARLQLKEHVKNKFSRTPFMHT